MLYFESNQGRQAGVENGCMLTTYVFRYTSECTISQSNFQKFLRLRWQGGIEPSNQNPADALGGEEAESDKPGTLASAAAAAAAVVGSSIGIGLTYSTSTRSHAATRDAIKKTYVS